MSIPILTFPPTVDTDSTLFLVANNKVTTLASGIGSGDTSLTVADASGLPADGFISIGTEVIHYVSKTGNVLNTLTRGADGTTNVAHNSGDTVSLRIIAIHHNRLKDAIIALQTYVLTIGGAGGMITEFTQSGHGFAVGDVLRHNGTIWVKAKADTVANAEAIGIVVEIVSINVFKLQCGGYTDKILGMTPASVYFLSDVTAGLLTLTEPTALNTVSKPLYLAMTANTGYVFNWRGLENAYSMSYNRTFTNADLDGSYNVTITHNLGVKYCIVSIYDNNDQEIKADLVTLVDANSLTLNLTEFAPITGSWRVVVLGMGTPITVPTTPNRGTFQNSDLVAGVLTITHNKGLSAPYTVLVQIFDNNGKVVIPDDITGATNSVAIDLTSQAPISGTWGYVYFA
jgi:hypothetical protein